MNINNCMKKIEWDCIVWNCIVELSGGVLDVDVSVFGDELCIFIIIFIFIFMFCIESY
jgi:hypothetical protein